MTVFEQGLLKITQDQPAPRIFVSGRFWTSSKIKPSDQNNTADGMECNWINLILCTPIGHLHATTQPTANRPTAVAAEKPGLLQAWWHFFYAQKYSRTNGHLKITFLCFAVIPIFPTKFRY